MDALSVVIVGAGHAAARAAEGLRKGGWTGRIVVIGSEGVQPYERPPVSKSLLFSADAAPRALWLSGAEGLDVEFVNGRALAIDRGERTVALRGGVQHRYTHLVLATGARPRQLARDSVTLERVFHLRTTDDAARLRPMLRRGAKLLVIGAGLIGLEVASGAAAAGLDVRVFEMAPRALGRAVPEAVAGDVLAAHAARGVDIRTGVAVSGVRDADDGVVVTCTDGSSDRFDLVLVAAGVTPRTELAAAAGLAVDNGVVTDATLATDDPHIFAVGDVANFPHALFGVRVRLESQQNADEQGRHVARRILGDATPFSAVPWFWSDQFDATLQVAGVPALGGTIVERPVEGGRCSLHLDPTGRLVGAAAFGPAGAVGREIGAARRLIAQRAVVPAEIAADARVDLREALRPNRLTPAV
jgi:3-phenylpropionate/trans-cinnamate dioxygenase ferredoxin reductase subunit